MGLEVYLEFFIINIFGFIESTKLNVYWLIYKDKYHIWFSRKWRNSFDKCEQARIVRGLSMTMICDHRDLYKYNGCFNPYQLNIIVPNNKHA